MIAYMTKYVCILFCTLVNHREVKLALTVSEVKANNKGFLTLAMRKIEIFATRLALDPRVQSSVHHVRMFESL